MATKFHRVREFVVAHQFACFIILCVAIALVMTLISLELYRRSGAIKLDMSRPGYEAVRTEVEKSSDDQPYDSSGPLNDSAINDFEDRIKKYQSELDELGTYDNSIISDDSLNLTEPAESSTTEVVQ